MAKLILGKWCGAKHVYINKCPITDIQDYINLKLIQDYNCRLNSPTSLLLNLVNINDTLSDRNKVYKDFNKKEIDVSKKNNWCINYNVLFLKLGTTRLNKEINFMIANSQQLINISNENIYDLIKDSLLHYNYEVDWI